MKIGAYLRLMRFDKPVGIMLLWLPTAWALWIANKGYPPLQLIAYFFLGTVVMRAAGCVLNDMADSNIDKYVKRTKQRPLARGEINFIEALLVLIILLSVALFIVLQLPFSCLYYAVVALFITILYPFCKRFFHAPQFILGLAFSMDIPMVYGASYRMVDSQMWVLFLLNIVWIISYDTMYAMVDRADDMLIGVRSTAVLFGENDCWIIRLLQSLFHGLWLFLAISIHLPPLFYGFWLMGAVVLIYQQRLVNTRDEPACFKAFLMNTWYGLIMWVGLIAAYSKM